MRTNTSKVTWMCGVSSFAACLGTSWLGAPYNCVRPSTCTLVCAFPCGVTLLGVFPFSVASLGECAAHRPVATSKSVSSTALTHTYMYTYSVQMHVDEAHFRRAIARDEMREKRKRMVWGMNVAGTIVPFFVAFGSATPLWLWLYWIYTSPSLTRFANLMNTSIVDEEVIPE